MMFFSTGKARCLAALILLALPAQPLHAGQSWWQRLTAGIMLALVGSGQSGAAPIEAPVPTAPKAPAPSAHAWNPQFGVLPWYNKTRTPPLEELMVVALADYRTADCAGPLPELLPAPRLSTLDDQEQPDRWMTDREALCRELASKEGFERFRTSTDEIVKTLRRYTACALRIHQETVRSDKDAVLLDDLTQAKVWFAHLMEALKHAASLSAALDERIWQDKHRAEAGPREGEIPLAARLELAEKAERKLDKTRQRFVRSILYLEVPLHPDGSEIRERRRHHAHWAVQDDFLRAPKILARPTPEDPYPQRWVLLPEPDADVDSDHALDADAPELVPKPPASPDSPSGAAAKNLQILCCAIL